MAITNNNEILRLTHNRNDDTLRFLFILSFACWWRLSQNAAAKFIWHKHQMTNVLVQVLKKPNAVYQTSEFHIFCRFWCHCFMLTIMEPNRLQMKQIAYDSTLCDKKKKNQKFENEKTFIFLSFFQKRKTHEIFERWKSLKGGWLQRCLEWKWRKFSSN